jgi:hypothetical protein
MAKDNQIPLYTKIGIRVTTVLMVILAFMLLKNCIGSIRYGTTTSQEEIQRFYDKGYRNGTEQAAEPTDRREPELDNPLLIKAYRQGFRAGWDASRRQ